MIIGLLKFDLVNWFIKISESSFPFGELAVVAKVNKIIKCLS